MHNLPACTEDYSSLGFDGRVHFQAYSSGPASGKESRRSVLHACPWRLAGLTAILKWLAELPKQV